MDRVVTVVVAARAMQAMEKKRARRLALNCILIDVDGIWMHDEL